MKNGYMNKGRWNALDRNALTLTALPPLSIKLPKVKKNGLADREAAGKKTVMLPNLRDWPGGLR